MLGGDKIQIWLLKLEKRRSKLESPENLLLFQLTTVQWKILYSRVRNKHTPMFINFLTFFQGLQPYSGLHRAYFCSISLRYKWGYAYSFCQIIQVLCLFKRLRLFQTLEYLFAIFSNEFCFETIHVLRNHMFCQFRPTLPFSLIFSTEKKSKTCPFLTHSPQIIICL